MSDKTSLPPAALLTEVVVAGVGTLVFVPSRISSRVLSAMHGLYGTLGAVGGIVVARGAGSHSLAVYAGAGVAGAGLMAAVSAVAVEADIRIESALQRRGVRHPRIPMAIAAAAIAYGLQRLNGQAGPQGDGQEALQSDGQASEDVEGPELH